MNRRVLEIVESHRRAFDGRAAGYWRVEGESLELVAFAPAPDLDPEVAEGFRAATARIPQGRPDLGVSKAEALGQTVVSEAESLPPETGSGRWLRAFGASHSVAVPIRAPDANSPIVGVLSVALGEGARVSPSTIERAAADTAHDLT